VSFHSDILYTFFQPAADTRDLPSFPTRRSSDLSNCPSRLLPSTIEPAGVGLPPDDGRARRLDGAWQQPARTVRSHPRDSRRRERSEEHTSELQSLAYLVALLLLEKKKSYKLRQL